MKCDRVRDAVQDEMGETASPLEMAGRLSRDVQEHLEECAPCRHFALEIRLLDVRLRDEMPVCDPAPPDLAAGIMAAVRREAASALLQPGGTEEPDGEALTLPAEALAAAPPCEAARQGRGTSAFPALLAGFVAVAALSGLGAGPGFDASMASGAEYLNLAGGWAAAATAQGLGAFHAVLTASLEGLVPLGNWLLFEPGGSPPPGATWAVGAALLGLAWSHTRFKEVS